MQDDILTSQGLNPREKCKRGILTKILKDLEGVVGGVITLTQNTQEGVVVKQRIKLAGSIGSEVSVHQRMGVSSDPKAMTRGLTQNSLMHE